MLFGDPVEWEHALKLQESVNSLKTLLELQTKEILSLRLELRSIEGERSRLLQRLSLSQREREFLREILKRIETTLEKSLDSPYKKNTLEEKRPSSTTRH